MRANIESAKIAAESVAGTPDAITEVNLEMQTFIRQFETAEQKVDRLLAVLQEYKAELDPAEFERIRNEILETLDFGSEIVVERFERTTEFAKDAVDEMAAFTDQAARNMQDAMADFFFDPFEDGLKGMVRSFADAVRRMLANQMALQVFKWFQGFGTSGGPSSSGADAANWLNSAFPRAAGGPVSAGSSYLVGEKGPELFVPNMSGNIIPNGAGGTVIHNHFEAGADIATIEARIIPMLEQTEERAVYRTQQLSREGRAA